MELLGRSVELRPDSAEYWGNLAGVLGRLGRFEQAVIAADEAIKRDGERLDSHLNRALALRQLGRLDEAAQAFGRVVTLRPEHAEGRKYLGHLLSRAGRFAEAVPHLREAVRLAPGEAGAHYHLGWAVRRLLKAGGTGAAAAEAVVALRRAAELRPGWVEAHCELGKALHDDGRPDEAVGCFERAIELRGDDVDAHWNLSLALLALGEWERGWLAYEWRRHLPADAPHAERERAVRPPRWAGQPVRGRTVLLTTEQGLGDTIQFARYAPLLAGWTGARVVLECQPPLRGMLQSLTGVEQGLVRVVARGEARPPFDCHARLMSVPGMLGTTPATVPVGVPYLRVEPGRVAEWKRRLEGFGPGFRVGVAWQGSRAHVNDALRSVPLRAFRPLAECAGVRLFSLQRGAGCEQLDGAGFAIERFIDLSAADEAAAFLDTAAAIVNLDLVVTCDTSLAHLAGALGRPVWVALPFVADWRWLRGRADSPWYPTMRLFRQDRPGDWAGVFGRMSNGLRRLRMPT